jgi:uncharacterized ion transporter superfamily protein YfcC
MNRKLFVFLGFLIFALIVIFVYKGSLAFFDILALFFAVGIIVGLLSKLLGR